MKTNILNEEEFWQLIEKAKNGKKIDVDLLIDSLAKRSVEEIYQFEEILTDKLFELDGEDYAKAVGYNPDEYFSVDSFLYARVYVVEQGKKFYFQVLNDPTMMQDEASESLLEVAQSAYSKKTGQEWEYLPTKLYETYFNREKWGLGKQLSIVEFLDRD